VSERRESKREIERETEREREREREREKIQSLLQWKEENIQEINLNVVSENFRKEMVT
jgi:hypothetical protein